MLRVLYITSILLLLFISCNNLPANRPASSSNDTGSIGLFLKKANSTANADSALYWASSAYKLSVALKDRRWLAKTQVVFSRLYRSKQEVDRGYDSLQKAITGLEQYGSKDDLGDALIEQVHYYDNAQYMDSSIPAQIGMIEQASELFRQAGDSEKYAAALCKMGYLYYMRGGDSTQRIIDTLKKALSIYKGANGSQYVYDAMALQYAKDGSWPQTIDLELRAINTAEKFNDTNKQVGQFYDQLGSCYYNMKQFTQSIPYLKKALAIDKKYSDTAGSLDVSQAIISSYYMSHQYNEAIEVLKETENNYKSLNADAFIELAGIALICYTATGKNELATPYRTKLIQYSAKYDKLNQSQAYVYTYLIDYYLRLKKYREAEKYCILADTFMHYYKIPRMIATNYDWWSSADSGLGHFEGAFNHLRNAKNIYDTLFNGESRKQLNELKIKYETEKKEQNIELLTKQALLQNTQLQKTKLTKNLLFGSAGMLALLLGLGYNRYRLKQRSNRKLQAKQEEINKKNESLNQLVKEKEWLVKEMHHRVKNNLQVVMSLLNTQSMYLDNVAAQTAIRESQHRMHTISLIHQKLYQSDNSAMVSMPAYVCELVDYLAESLDERMRIHFEKAIENIELDVAEAIPVGLILNEAITNAIKYAFPHNQKGMITVTMTRDKMHNVSLVIKDNGIGLSDNIANKIESLGMNLMDGLASQLGGMITKTNDRGFRIEVVFSDAKGITVS